MRERECEMTERLWIDLLKIGKVQMNRRLLFADHLITAQFCYCLVTISAGSWRQPIAVQQPDMNLLHIVCFWY